MLLDEDTLERAAQDGEMQYEKWPSIYEPLIERINYIAYTEFAVPRPYPIIHPSRRNPSPNRQMLEQSTTSQMATPTQNGATIPATPTSSRNLPPVPLFPSTQTTETTPATSQIPDSQPQPALPTPLLHLLTSITTTLQSSFSNLPPHTLQRLSELILTPKTHYRTLPAWLRALDRVVSVTSTADIFPLPKAMPLPTHVIDSSLLLTNGVHDDENEENGDTDGLGSDESLGGALLTPIPWLRHSEENEVAELDILEENDDLLGGPIEILRPNNAFAVDTDSLLDNAAPTNPMVPERADGAVTQGELIRQEQEAGVVPVGHSDADAKGMMLDQDDDEESEEEVPHARGPGTLGAVDVGRVGGQDVEVELESAGGGRGGNGRGVRDAQEVLVGGRRSGTNVDEGDQMQVDEQLLKEEKEVSDGDIVLTDVDGRQEDESKVGQEPDSENTAVDAVDTSSM